MPGLEEDNHKKRKLAEVQEIEIDVSAPEPPSKKALRKAKKKGIDPAAVTSSATKDETETETKAGATQTQDPPKKRSDYGIWIGNLSFTTTKDDLRKFFTTNCSFSDASITRIHLPMGSSRLNGTPQNKGFAYVDFSTEKAMNEAVGLSEQLIAGRRVLIKGAKNFEGRPEQHQQAGSSKASAASGHPPSRRIFIGNLGFDATKELLQEHFSPCGPITSTHVATFEDTGKCKGYAWVEFETVEAAESAVKGFVKVQEDDDDDEEEDEETGSDAEDKPKKARKPKTKKVWVNRFLGRQLRMEFAEDAVTRYKKRFGKDAKGKGKGTATDGEELDGNDATTGDSGEGAQSKERRPRKENQKPYRYSKETVQKLTGAIVEAQGKKITFDES